MMRLDEQVGELQWKAVILRDGFSSRQNGVLRLRRSAAAAGMQGCSFGRPGALIWCWYVFKFWKCSEQVRVNAPISTVIAKQV